MTRSLRAQLTATLVGLTLVLMVVVAVVAVTTNNALEETLAEQRAAEKSIADALAKSGTSTDDPDAAALIDELARTYGARIVVTDTDGQVLVDTGSGELPPLVDAIGSYALAS